MPYDTEYDDSYYPEPDISPENIKRLTDIHLNRYYGMQFMAQNGERGYRLSEINQLIEVWESIKSKNYIFDNLSASEECEVLDAIEDDY